MAEYFSEARLAAMESHGWTPQDVRDLIAAYKNLAYKDASSGRTVVVQALGCDCVRLAQVKKHPSLTRLLDVLEMEHVNAHVDGRDDNGSAYRLLSEVLRG